MNCLKSTNHELRTNIVITRVEVKYQCSLLAIDLRQKIYIGVLDCSYWTHKGGQLKTKP